MKQDDKLKLPKGWEMKRLDEVCTFINGKAYNKNDLLNSGKYPVLRVGNFFTNNHWYYSDLELPEDKYCDSGDLLYAWSASFGPKIWTGEKVIYHYHIWKVVPDNKQITKEFLYLLLDWDTEKIKTDQGTGTTMMHVGKGSMDARIVPLPPLPEQQRIVSILDEAFAAIATAKANAEKNLKNASELFDSYLQGVFENKSEGWEEKRLGDVATFRNGINYTKNSKGEKIHIVGVKDFQNSFWVPFETLETVILDGKFNDLDLLKEGDILAVRSNGNPLLIGRTLLASKVVGKVSHSGFTIRIRLNSNNIDPIYLCNYLKISSTRKILVDRGNGVGIKSLNQGSLSELLIPFPNSIETQQAIVEKLDALSSETRKLEAIYQKKILSLEELKKSILQKAFRGELTKKEKII